MYHIAYYTKIVSEPAALGTIISNGGHTPGTYNYSLHSNPIPLEFVRQGTAVQAHRLVATA